MLLPSALPAPHARAANATAAMPPRSYRLLVVLQEDLADSDIRVRAAAKASESAAKDLRSASKRGSLARSPDGHASGDACDIQFTR